VHVPPLSVCLQLLGLRPQTPPGLCSAPGPRWGLPSPDPVLSPLQQISGYATACIVLSLLTYSVLQQCYQVTIVKRSWSRAVWEPATSNDLSNQPTAHTCHPPHPALFHADFSRSTILYLVFTSVGFAVGLMQRVYKPPWVDAAD